MSANVVIGQPDFVSGSTTAVNAATFGTTIKGVFVDHNGKLYIVDRNRNRVLIYNSIPTTNGAAADLVLGQPDFISSTANNGGRGANTFNLPMDLWSDGDKLFVADNGNQRVLIWNTIPTVNNQAADVVVGQTSMTTTTTGCNSSNFSGGPGGIAVYNNKLIVSSRLQNRIMVWNSVPTTNGVAADVVLGQANMTTCETLSASSSSINQVRGISVDNQGRLYVADQTLVRIMIWNSIPTTNNQPADVVVGQTNFTNSGTTNPTASTFTGLEEVFANGNRLFVPHGYNRVSIFNSIPISNGASADIVLGQADFTSSSANAGQSSVNAQGFSAPNGIFEYNNKLLVADQANSRILVFENTVNNPGLSFNNSPEEKNNGFLRLNGHASLPSDSLYTLSNVQYSINNGGFLGATPTDGNLNSTSEDFYFDFDPKSNQQKDSSGNLINGYTVRVKSTNSNADETDHLFYFSPLNPNEPQDNTVINSSAPAFDFGVIKQKSLLRNNLSKYKIQIRKGGNDSTALWETYIDDIPIDGTLDNSGTNSFENDKLRAVYTDDSSRIKVYSKTKTLTGNMQWRIAAVDKAGHAQDSSARSLRVNTKISLIVSNFPLSILNISGLGNPNISTNNLNTIKDTYYLGSLIPIFYGIAFTNAKVTLTLTEQDCPSANCTKTYLTIANPDSRYGINIPRGDLKWGKKYTTNMSVALDQDYNELPSFTLSASGNASNTVKPKVTLAPQPTVTPSLTPTPQPIGIKQEVPSKQCFLFLCF